MRHTVTNNRIIEYLKTREAVTLLCGLPVLLPDHVADAFMGVSIETVSDGKRVVLAIYNYDIVCELYHQRFPTADTPKIYGLINREILLPFMGKPESPIFISTTRIGETWAWLRAGEITSDYPFLN